MFRELLKKVLLKIKLFIMDNQSSLLSTESFTMYPPSFYYTHTEEEAKMIIMEEQRKLYELIDRLKEENDNES